MYSPVRIEARLGEQSDVVTKAFFRCTPLRRQRVQVRRFQERMAHESHRVVAVVVRQDENHVSRLDASELGRRRKFVRRRVAAKSAGQQHQGDEKGKGTPNQ